MALTDTNISYESGSGLQTFTMDTILSDSPACGFTTINYLVHETGLFSGYDLSTYGITTDNSVDPPNLKIDASLAA
jgi:hypothetical protein